MRRIIWLLMGAAVGGACVWAGLQYHVVRTKDGFTYVPKQSVTLADTYVDVRSWGPMEWVEHRDLALSLAQHGKKDIIPQTLESRLGDAFRIK